MIIKVGQYNILTIKEKKKNGIISIDVKSTILNNNEIFNKKINK